MARVWRGTAPARVAICAQIHANWTVGEGR
jgi:hypothetical protein